MINPRITTNPVALAMPQGFEQACVSVTVTAENCDDVMAFVFERVRNGVPLYGPDDPPPIFFGQLSEENADAEHRAPERSGPPDGLRTSAEAARKLRCSVRTLTGHVTAGALGYVLIGHGRKRPRRMFTDSDLEQFIAISALDRSQFRHPANHEAG
jgi:hypothetical protein